MHSMHFFSALLCRLEASPDVKYTAKLTLAMACQSIFDAGILAKPAQPVCQKVSPLAARALHNDHTIFIGLLAEGLG